MIAWSDVVDIATELATVPVDTQTAILNDVTVFLSEVNWGSRYDLASKYLAAHWATIYLRGGTGPSGDVIEERTADVAKRYASSVSSDLDLGATPYGKIYLSIRETLLARVGFVC